ncbi:putative RDD family membrane protein YckC [Haloactinospora alba]|uniref:Putative RDD family membrane protein YckC n=1 Tax=Haloactinospora alba TaxID=405555 RepID=A0A543NMZ7_9ACTN|nr:RDD family protein [Haloactinospora alba]TQN33193.1 putative RDD family membrane protein YckC [Haloactinospora alba]
MAHLYPPPGQPSGGHFPAGTGHPHTSPHGPHPAAPQGYPAWPGGAAAGPALASWPARACAYLVDMLVTVPVAFGIFVGGMLLSIEVFDAEGKSAEETPEMMLPVALLPLLAAFAVFAYFWLLHARWGRTLGKLLTGIRVVSLRTGRPPSLAPAAGRSLVHLALSMATCLGWLVDLLWPLWDEPYRQTLHDKAVGSCVVRAR